MEAGASLQKLHVDTINNLIENDFRPMIASTYLFAMDRFTGTIAGTPVKAGVYHFTVRVVDYDLETVVIPTSLMIQ